MTRSPHAQLTTLDFSILGLLMQQPLTGYGIRMMFKKTALASYSSSPGAIYPALKRLARLNMVVKKRQGSSPQELFTITRMGIAALTQWVIQPVTREDIIKNFEIILLRFAFMDLVAAASSKRKFLKSLEKTLSAYVIELESYHAMESAKMPVSGRLAFEHGLDSFRTSLRWVKRIISSKKY